MPLPDDTQVANWLLYYREALHGVPIEELRRRREVRAEEEAAKLLPPPETDGVFSNHFQYYGVI